MSKYNKVMLLYGGVSAEREISIITSKEISRALVRLGYEVIEIDADLDLSEHISEHKPDVIFNGLHGTWGEDGEVQKILELNNVPYTHSGIKASQLAMDKHKSAELFIKNNFNYPITNLVNTNNINKHAFPEYPFVIKPRNEGSSVGVGIIRNQEEKKRYLTDNSDRNEVLVQEFIDGQEINVAVIGNEKAGSIEIDPKNEFYDYESKYFDNGKTKHIIPPRINKNQLEEVEDLALKAHKILGCKGISRTEFILEKNSNQFYILELNTQPGMTPTSLVPEIAKDKGIEFDELINWILEDAGTNR